MVATLVPLAVLAALAATPAPTAPTVGVPGDFACTPLVAAFHRLGVPTPRCSTSPSPRDAQPAKPQGGHDGSTPWPKAPLPGGGGGGDPMPWPSQKPTSDRS